MSPTLLHRDHTGSAYGLAIAGDRVCTAGGDGFVLAWQASQPTVSLAIARMPYPVYCLACSSVGRILMVGTSNGDLHAIDLGTNSLLGSVAAHSKGVYAVLPLPDGRMLAAGGDGTISSWRLMDKGLKGPERRIPLCEGKVRGLSLSADQGTIAAATGDGGLHLLDARDLNAKASWPAHEGGSNAVLFHPTKPVLHSVGKDGHLRAWRTDEPGKPLFALPAHRGAIYALAMSDGLLAASSRDKTITLWDPSTLTLLQRLGPSRGGHSHSVNALAFKGRDLISTGDDRRVLLWRGDQKG